MANPIELFHSARQRVIPEGLMFSASVTAASPFVLPGSCAAITFAIHEVSKETDPNVTKLATVGVISLLAALSIGVETRALESHKYSCSPISNASYILTGRPFIASLCGHLINYAQVSVINPINFFAVATKDLGLLVESEEAAVLALSAWLITLNTLILQGKTRPFIEKVRKVKAAAKEKLKR